MEKVLITKHTEIYSKSCGSFVSHVIVQENCLIRGLTIGFLEVKKGAKIVITDCIIEQITLGTKCIIERCKIVNLFAKHADEISICENSF